MNEYKATYINKSVKHIPCGGDVWVDGMGKQRRTQDFGMGFEGRQFKMAAAYSWHKTFSGDCEKCRKHGLFVVVKPYKKSKRVFDA